MSEEKIIKGRSRETALTLLAAAAQLDLPKDVVRTQMGGYKVPAEVAERYEELRADLDESNAEPEGDAKPEGDAEPAAKRTATKRTAKKTAAKAAAKKE